MSSGPTTLPESSQQERARSGWLQGLRNMPIRSKLALILVVPITAVLALGTVRLVDVGRGAYRVSEERALTDLAMEVSALAQDLHKERMAAAALLAAGDGQKASYDQHIRQTEQRITAYKAEREALDDVPAAVLQRLQTIDRHLDTLNTTRQEIVEDRQMPVAEATLRYSVILTDLVSYGEALAQLPGENELADARRAVAAFSRAKASAAEEEAVAFAALSSGRVDDEQYSSFVATLTSQQEALTTFTLSASPQQRSLVEGTVNGDAVVLADQVASDLGRSVHESAPLISAKDASNRIGAVNDLMRWVEIQLQTALLERSDQIRTDVIRQAIIEVSLILITLVLAVVLALVLARALNLALRRLREAALSVANHDLPEAVERLQNVESVTEGGVDQIVREIGDAISVPRRDEIGDVAQAFNVVHREAVRIAAEQAALRTNVSAMFLNLARRSQTLVDRMIGELDMIERGEEDPKRLAQLFELDHLATRMRRNDENLLVLAGADSAAPRRDDALLVDVLRAAQSEVELYNRIEFGPVDTDISVAAHAVNDVVRLLAELLDNATRFSPPSTVVVADARRIRDYVVVQIEDRGLGLSDEQLASLNRRLAEPQTMDASAFRLMGLAVVSRLAGRYEIRVELRRNPEGGTVAQVTLPNTTVVMPLQRGIEQPLLRSRPPLAVEQGPVNRFGANADTDSESTSSSTTLLEQRRPGFSSASLWQPTGGSQDSAFPVSAQPSPPVAPASAPPAMPGSPTMPGSPAMPTSVPPVTPASAPPAATPVMPAMPVSGSFVDTPTVATPVISPLPRRVAGGETSQTASPMSGGPASTPTAPAAGMHTPSPSFGTPAAAMPAGPVAGMPSASAPGVRRPDNRTTAPIFEEMEAVWFRTHGNDATAIFSLPDLRDDSVGGKPEEPVSTGRTAPTHRLGGSALPARQPGAVPVPPQMASPTPAPPTPSPAPAPTPPAAPDYSGAGRESWRTAADEGWARASQAAEPTDGGTTRSGLPKRVPQAQLVPGGIETKKSQGRNRRTPDEVRGLLSAYHRGVQRGRSAGADPNSTSTKETSE